MNTEMSENKNDCRKTGVVPHHGTSNAIYGLGFVGACVYFIGQATTFWLGVLGFLKALVWPALLIFELLKYLNM